MKKKNIIYACVTCIMLAFAVVCFVNVSGNTVKAEKMTIDARGLKHGCDLLGQDKIADDLINGYRIPQAGAVEEAINDGYMVAYVDAFKACGLVSPDFVPSTKGSTTTDSTGTSKTETPKAPTLTEIDAAPYVTIKEAVLLDGYNNGTKTGEIIESDTDIVVNGYSSNGYYRLEDGSYVSQNDVVSKEDYDAAWTVIEEIPATCSENGSVKKSNSLTGKEVEETLDVLEHEYSIVDEAGCTCIEKGYTTYECKLCGDTYTEEYEAWGHEAGEPVVTVEPDTFSKGTMTTYCTICGEELSEESIPQTFPIPLWGVIVIAVVVVSCIAGGTVFIIKKRK